LVVRSEVQRGFSAFVLAAVLAAIAGGAAIAAAAGARRSESAYPRFLVWSRHADFATGGGTPAWLAKDLKAIERAPFVDEAAHVPVVGAHVELPNGKVFQPFQVAVVDDADDTLARGVMDREKVLRGHRSDPSSPTDATVSFATAERLGVDVGDALTLVPDEGGRPVTVRVVGVVVRPGEFPTLSGGTRTSVALTSAFKRAHPSLFSPGNDGLLVRVKPGTARSEVEAWLSTHLHETDIEDEAVLDSAVERTIRLETVALWAVAAVLTLVFVVLLGQLLFRQAIAAADDVTILTTLGFTRRQVTGLGAARGALVGGLGAAGAVAVAIISSPLTPVGLGRLAEPNPGLWIDATVLLIGGVVIVALTTGFGALGARRAASPAAEYGSDRRSLTVPNVPPAVRAGLQVLLRPARRRDARLTRTSVASLCVVVAAVTAVLVMLTSLSHLRDTPALAGATWDGALVVGERPSEPALDAALTRLAALPDVAAVNGSGWTTVVANGREIPVQVFDDRGGIGPAIAAGRAPSRGEIALGADEMHRLGVGLGDRMQVSAGPGARPVDLAVVGRSVLIAPIFRQTAPGDGGALTTATMRMLGVPRVDASGLAIVRFAPGIDQAAALDRDAKAVHAEFAFGSRDRTIVGGVKRVQTVPIALIVVLGVLGAAAFVHLQLVSTRRRRLDIAVLQTMGFTRRQVTGMVAVQAVGVALAALAIGVPLGLLGGRLGWIRFADHIRAVARPTTTPAVLAAVALVLLVTALVAGLASGLRAALVRPAPVLRTETG
jgi:ABC-type lipoprotein release transport system permease subunit